MPGILLPGAGMCQGTCPHDSPHKERIKPTAYKMKRIILILACVCGATHARAQYTYTDSIQWQTYEDFNKIFLDAKKNIYRDHSARTNAVDRWNGAAAIWCQAIFYDMVQNAYRRAVAEKDEARQSKYSTLHRKIYLGEKAQYVNFNFDDCNTNTGWFVYDDIMWWTAALARAYETFQRREYLIYAERSFCRVWYGSAKVGDDGSYADPARGLGGGMFWEWQPIDKPKPHQPGDFRSACINFPTVIAACTLHNIVPEGRKSPTAARPTQQTREWYLEKAKEVYAWADGTLVKNGRVADGIHGGGPEFNDHLYNQATYIGASCLLYQITGQDNYLLKAKKAANYVFTSMCSGGILPWESGVEQGVYAAIFAQYMHMLVYDCGQTQYMTYIKRNLQRGWDKRDKTRGISNGNFRKDTAEDSQIDSYSASALPALMLMFPAGDSASPVRSVTAASHDTRHDGIYTIDGKRVASGGEPGQREHLASGMYICGQRKMLVR